MMNGSPITYQNRINLKRRDGETSEMEHNLLQGAGSILMCSNLAISTKEQIFLHPQTFFFCLFYFDIWSHISKFIQVQKKKEAV